MVTKLFHYNSYCIKNSLVDSKFSFFNTYYNLINGISINKLKYTNINTSFSIKGSNLSINVCNSIYLPKKANNFSFLFFCFILHYLNFCSVVLFETFSDIMLGYKPLFWIISHYLKGNAFLDVKNYFINFLNNLFFISYETVSVVNKSVFNLCFSFYNIDVFYFYFLQFFASNSVNFNKLVLNNNLNLFFSFLNENKLINYMGWFMAVLLKKNRFEGKKQFITRDTEISKYFYVNNTKEGDKELNLKKVNFLLKEDLSLQCKFNSTKVELSTFKTVNTKYSYLKEFYSNNEFKGISSFLLNVLSGLDGHLIFEGNKRRSLNFLRGGSYVKRSTYERKKALSVLKEINKERSALGLSVINESFFEKRMLSVFFQLKKEQAALFNKKSGTVKSLRSGKFIGSQRKNIVLGNLGVLYDGYKKPEYELNCLSHSFFSNIMKFFLRIMPMYGMFSQFSRFSKVKRFRRKRLLMRHRLYKLFFNFFKNLKGVDSRKGILLDHVLFNFKQSFFFKEDNEVLNLFLRDVKSFFGRRVRKRSIRYNKRNLSKAHGLVKGLDYSIKYINGLTVKNFMSIYSLIYFSFFNKKTTVTGFISKFLFNVKECIKFRLQFIFKSPVWVSSFFFNYNTVLGYLSKSIFKKIRMFDGNVFLNLLFSKRGFLEYCLDLGKNPLLYSFFVDRVVSPKEMYTFLNVNSQFYMTNKYIYYMYFLVLAYNVYLVTGLNINKSFLRLFKIFITSRYNNKYFLNYKLNSELFFLLRGRSLVLSKR